MRNARFVVALVVLGLIVLGVPLLARADSNLSDPQFGACWAEFCVGPRVAAPAMAVELKTGDVTLGFQPGFGYGFERTGKLSLGIAAFVSLRDTADGQRVAPAILFSIARYVHTGPAMQTGSDRRWFWLLTLGSDLGMSR